MVPSVNCIKPKAALSLMAHGEPGLEGDVVMDEQEFKSEAYQRVYQYLNRHALNQNLDRFSFITTTEGTPEGCLQIILKWVEKYSYVVYFQSRKRLVRRCTCTTIFSLLTIHEHYNVTIIATCILIIVVIVNRQVLYNLLLAAVPYTATVE